MFGFRVSQASPSGTPQVPRPKIKNKSKNTVCFLIFSDFFFDFCLVFGSPRGTPQVPRPKIKNKSKNTVCFLIFSDFFLIFVWFSGPPEVPPKSPGPKSKTNQKTQCVSDFRVPPGLPQRYPQVPRPKIKNKKHSFFDFYLGFRVPQASPRGTRGLQACEITLKIHLVIRNHLQNQKIIKFQITFRTRK